MIDASPTWHHIVRTRHQPTPTTHPQSPPSLSVLSQVVASICRPEQVMSSVSNTFDFTFRIPERPTCRKVLPSNGDQARRMVERIEVRAVRWGRVLTLPWL